MTRQKAVTDLVPIRASFYFYITCIVVLSKLSYDRNWCSSHEIFVDDRNQSLIF